MKAPQPALWWQPADKGRILCTLCPRDCLIPEGKNGFCFIRRNEGGKLVTQGYGRPTGLQVDPIEKKPLSHFLPGTTILSLGGAGCNLGCRFCQNWNTSKAKADQVRSADLPPEDVVQLALKQNAPSIAYTYNDPTIWGEYVIDIAKIAHENGLKNVMVTAGYIHEQPFRDIYQHIDAANVDLKAFAETFYYKLTFSHLQPVLDTLLRLKNETGVWVEITNLIIPGQNDSQDETKRMCDWIYENLGPDVPMHFTAFHPDFKMLDTPRTPPATLDRAREIAIESGIRYVYVGNVHNPNGQTTYCPNCQTPVIERDWHSVSAYRVENGRCPDCNATIAGVFDDKTIRAGNGVVRSLPF